MIISDLFKPLIGKTLVGIKNCLDQYDDLFDTEDQDLDMNGADVKGLLITNVDIYTDADNDASFYLTVYDKEADYTINIAIASSDNIIVE